MLNSTAEAGHKIEAILRDRGYRLDLIQPVNKGRHLVLKTVDSATGLVHVFYVLYKRAYFLLADRLFNTTEGFFESINTEYYEALRKSKMLTQILVCYPEGIIYSVDPAELHMYLADNYRLRTQWDSKEETVSFPISLYARWDVAWSCYELDKWMGKPGMSDKIKAMLRKLKQRLFPTEMDIRGVR